MSSERDELSNVKLEKADLRTEISNFGPEKANLLPQNTSLRPERADSRFEKARLGQMRNGFGFLRLGCTPNMNKFDRRIGRRGNVKEKE